LLSALDYQIHYFHPRSSYTGFVEAHFSNLKKPDVIWVPCFRQRDIESASRWAKKWNIPLIVDPLISAYEKEVFERNKWSPDSHKAERRRKWEAGLFSLADVVVADTPAHADFFEGTLGVAPGKLSVLYVGAENNFFQPAPLKKTPAPGPCEILFYGSFLQLQGVDTIVRAAGISRNTDARWVLLGDGDLKPAMEKAAEGITKISFEPWIPYARLPERIAKADILLGIFGTTKKADLVIPNKMFQAMAAGKPVITRYAEAYPSEMRASDIIGWVPCGDHVSLAEKAREWIQEPEKLAERGKKTRELFERFFNNEKMKGMLSMILSKALGGRP
jgi:glycosyltransferase involved in cell wall biosynthesis